MAGKTLLIFAQKDLASPKRRDLRRCKEWLSKRMRHRRGESRRLSVVTLRITRYT